MSSFWRTGLPTNSIRIYISSHSEWIVFELYALKIVHCGDIKQLPNNQSLSVTFVILVGLLWRAPMHGSSLYIVWQFLDGNGQANTGLIHICQL